MIVFNLTFVVYQLHTEVVCMYVEPLPDMNAHTHPQSHFQASD